MNTHHTGLLAHVRSFLGGALVTEGPEAETGQWRLEPFLHVDPHQIYNPLTGRKLTSDDKSHRQVQRLYDGRLRVPDLRAAMRDELLRGGWLVPDPGEDLGRSFRLKYASIEAGTVCNQACYFCPVSVDPRERHTMSIELYERIVEQMSAYKDTLEGVSMVQYNEPTVDKLFVERLKLLWRYGLSPAVFSNGTGLTPDRVELIVESGGLRYLTINLSTMNRERYAADRGHDHLDVVLRNVDYLASRRVAPQMEIMVLGRGDEDHQADFRAIQERYGDSEFEVKCDKVMDRAGAMDSGGKPPQPIRRLRGCDQTGSRPVEWVHVTPYGQCVICCQDYHNQYVVGDLNESSLDEILSGDEMAKMRKWAYGLEEAPEDFICRHCIYARGE